MDKDQYRRDMNQGSGTWVRARAAGVDEQTISRQREVRDGYHQEYLRTEAIEIEGVVDTLAELSRYVRMAIVTTVKRAHFDLIHEKRLGATKEETLVVEDSSRGLNSAVAAGIDCAIVHNDFTKAHDFSQAGYRIRTLMELKDITREAV